MMVPSVHSTSHTIFDRLDEHSLAEPAAAARVASHAVLLAKLVPGIVAILPSLGVDVHARRRKIGRARVAAYLVGHLDAVALAGLFALCVGGRRARSGRVRGRRDADDARDAPFRVDPPPF